MNQSLSDQPRYRGIESHMTQIHCHRMCAIRADCIIIVHMTQLQSVKGRLEGWSNQELCKLRKYCTLHCTLPNAALIDSISATFNVIPGINSSE